MNKSTLFKNALLIDPKNEREFIGSILTRDGNICEIFNSPDPNYSISDCEIIDCNNNTLSPGLIDMWVFVGEPGYEHIETIDWRFGDHLRPLPRVSSYLCRTSLRLPHDGGCGR